MARSYSTLHSSRTERKLSMNRVTPGFGFYYYPDENRLEPIEGANSWGLFSTFNILLSNITLVHRSYSKLPEKIDLKNGLSNFKSNKENDLYGKLFKIDDSINIPQPYTCGPDEHHTLYTDKLVKGLQPYIKKYFNLSDELVEIKNKLLRKYNLLNQDYISVIFRGTDQFTDRGGRISVNCVPYDRIAKSLITDIPEEDRRLIIQSEEPRVVNHFKHLLGAMHIEETDIGTIGPLGLPIPTSNLDEWVKYYVVSIYIHSQAKSLITYTGNSGFFATLFRGNLNGVYQESAFTLEPEFFFKKN